MTFLGDGAATDSAMHFASDTEGTLRSMLLDVPATAIEPVTDLCSTATAIAGTLSIAESMIADHFPVGENRADTFDERTFTCGATGTSCRAEGFLSFVTGGDYTAPSFTSSATTRALCASTPPVDTFFDAAGAAHCGAIGATDWTTGWTTFPRN